MQLSLFSKLALFIKKNIYIYNIWSSNNFHNMTFKVISYINDN